MPPKKFRVKEKNAFPKTQELKRLLTSEELAIEEKKYENHIKNLKDCNDYVKAASTVVAEFKKRQRNSDKWEEYVNCCALPNPCVPAEIRLFMEQLRDSEARFNASSAISWLLATNDRSILTQNLSREDVTRSALKMRNEEPFGLDYDQFIEGCLKMLERIDGFLEEVPEEIKCGKENLSDVKELRVTLRRQISDLLNRFTYRILCSEESYMNSIDAITTEYTFRANNFQIHIWSLQNVPIRFTQLDSHLIAHLSEIKASLSVPTAVLKDNFSLRALHFNFDHISDNVQTFWPQFFEASSCFSLQDLTESLNSERLRQLDLQKRVKHQLLTNWQKYEEQLKLYEEQEAKLRDKNHTEKGIKKGVKVKTEEVLKPVLEPIFISDDLFPDVREEFLHDDQKEYELYCSALSRELSLKPDEINLRKYFILGGIYQLYSVEKPQHFHFNNFNMTWHLNNSQLAINEEVIVGSESSVVPRSSRVFKRDTLTLSHKVEHIPEPVDYKCPWFVLTIHLPEYLCHWGEPVVCRYETLSKAKSNSADSAEAEEPKQKTDQLSNSPSKYFEKQRSSASLLDLQQPCKEIFLRTSCSNTQIRLSDEKCALEDRQHGPESVRDIYDFPLNSLISKSGIRQLENHILPRMISSFQFNKEIKKDASVESRSQTKRGNLIKKRAHSKAQKNADKSRLFTLKAVQNSPERLIPVYSAVTPIRILQLRSITKDSRHKPQTFGQLVAAVDSIKSWHKLKDRHLMGLKPFKSKFHVANRRIESSEKLKIKSLTLRAGQPLKSGLQLATNKSSNKIVSDDSTQSAANDANEKSIAEDLPLATHSYWSSRDILKSEYKREKRTVVIQTNRLGKSNGSKEFLSFFYTK